MPATVHRQALRRRDRHVAGSTSTRCAAADVAGIGDRQPRPGYRYLSSPARTRRIGADLGSARHRHVRCVDRDCSGFTGRSRLGIAADFPLSVTATVSAATSTDPALPLAEVVLAI